MWAVIDLSEVMKEFLGAGPTIELEGSMNEYMVTLLPPFCSLLFHFLNHCSSFAIAFLPRVSPQGLRCVVAILFRCSLRLRSFLIFNLLKKYLFAYAWLASDAFLFACVDSPAYTERDCRPGEQHERILRTAQGVSSASLTLFVRALSRTGRRWSFVSPRCSPLNKSQSKIEHREKLSQQNKTASNANGVKVLLRRQRL
jgi:hypothetical protein